MLNQRVDSVDGGEPHAQARVDPRELDERRLLGQIVARQLPAFDALYRCYHPRLARFLDRMTRRPSLVEEVLNDTMFVVWSRANTYNGQCKVSTWIFAIAYRKALKALRRLDEPMEVEDSDVQVCEDPGPEQHLGQLQMNELLLGALDALSAEHRAVVDLTYFHGADYREIAAIVDCPVGTVKTRMFHARRRLKTLLAGRMEELR
jgi:RNA polymerase sigma factor (sigma-70 family)